LNPAASLPANLESRTTHAFVGENFAAGYQAYKKFAALVQEGPALNPRNLLCFRESTRPPLDLIEVEPLEAIFARFSTAAMSHGALSSEAHETLPRTPQFGAMSSLLLSARRPSGRLLRFGAWR